MEGKDLPCECGHNRWKTVKKDKAWRCRGCNLKIRKESKIVWTTLDGRWLPLEKVTDTHLANIINYIRSVWSPQRSKDLLKQLLAEAKNRKLSKEFLARAPIPWQDVDGKWKRLSKDCSKYEVIGR